MHPSTLVLGGRCILDRLLLSRVLLLSIASLGLSLSFQFVQVFINHCGSSHTGVTAFNHTCLTTLDDILIHLDRSETHQFIETHDSLLNIERLS